MKGIPPGRTLCFRDWGFSLEGLALAKAKGHKFHLISEILELIPDLPVILVGDSGQKDPEIYHAIAESFPGRLHAAFIRDVTDNPLRAASIEKLAKEVKASGALFHLAKDSLDVARRAAEQGWIREDAVAKIAKEVEEDGRDPDALDDLVES